MATTIRNFTITRTDGATVQGYMYPDSGNAYVTEGIKSDDVVNPYGSRSTFKAVCNMGQDLAMCGFTMENGDVVTVDAPQERESFFDRAE